MKLRSLLLGIMIAGVFVACSDDDKIPGTDPVTKGSSTLSVQIANVQTKALGDTKVDDKTISDLAVIVFNGTAGNAPIEAIGHATSQEGRTVTELKMSVTSGNKKVLVLANLTEEQLNTMGVAVGATYSSVESKQLAFSTDEKNGTLSMNSAVYTVSLKDGVINYLGYKKNDITDGNYLDAAHDNPVYLYRNVAKAALAKIALNPYERYKDATFDVKEVFILHGHKNSLIMGGGGAGWGTTHVAGSYLNGASDSDYEKWVAYMKEYADKKIFNYIEDKEANPYEGYLPKNANSLDEEVEKIQLSKNKTSADMSNAFYMYENTTVDAKSGYYTLLVVKGDFTYIGEDGKVAVSADRYYSVALGVTGFDENYSLPDKIEGLSDLDRNGAKTFKGLLRNLQYNITMNIKGPGYTTPFGPHDSDDTNLGVEVQVVTLTYTRQEVNVGGDE